MPTSLRGQFLVATRDLKDPNFHRTVVLMIEHNKQGAMGVVVNRPSGVTVSQALSDHFELPETEDMVFWGGPVEEEAYFILHNSAELDTSESPIAPGLFAGSSAEVFEEVVRSAAEGLSDVQFRVFAGCAGWGPKQLEGELARSDWLVCPAGRDFIFHDDPYALWQAVLDHVRQTHRLLPGIEGRPELN
jgi:putative transcriptional regulator